MFIFVVFLISGGHFVQWSGTTGCAILKEDIMVHMCQINAFAND